MGHNTVLSYGVKKVLLPNIVLAVLCVACATAPPVKRAYSGPELPLSEISVVRGVVTEVSLRERTQWVSIHSVDGVAMTRNVRGTQIHILPGSHRLHVGWKYLPERRSDEYMPDYFTAERVTWRFEKDLDLMALAGHEYLIKFHRFTNDSEWIVKWKDIVYWIEDLGTGAVVSGERPSELLGSSSELPYEPP